MNEKIIVSAAVAAMALSTGAFAESDMKVSGHVKLWYQTMDNEGTTGDNGLFKYDSANGNEWGDLGVQLKATGSLKDNISYNVALNGVTTMGLEGHIVGGETTRGNWASAGVNGTAAQPFWFHEVNMAYTSGKTIFKLGRQELNTPLAYTEKWNATSNSFEAAVLINQDLPDTTLVAAWVAKGNGATGNLVYAPQVFGAESQFNSYMGYDLDADGKNDTGGALALAAVNNSMKDIPVQAWYYHVSGVANAYWVQADAKMDAFSAQAIFAGVGVKDEVKDFLEGAGSDTGTTTAMAAKVAGSFGMFNAYAAFCSISEGNVPVANTATNYKKTKLPTASIFSDGMVAAQPDTTSFKVGGSAKVDGVGTFALSYGSYAVGENAGYVSPNAAVGGPASMGVIANSRGEDMDVSEIDVVYKTKINDVDLAAMYIHVDQTYVPGNGTYGSAGVDYGTAANDIVRIVATLNF